MGLGNPGPHYQDTRHNAGFWFLDRWAGIHQLSFVKQWFRPYSFCRAEVGGDQLVFVKPMTFVNRSGKVLEQLFSIFGVSREDLLVVFDQMDLPPGRVRLKPHGSSAGHNGLKSIDEALGSGQYHRLAIGVGRPRLAEDVIDYVLGVFSPEEHRVVESAIDKAVLLADSLWKQGWEPVIHAVNQRDNPAS
jgi:PTH1 family peptidyl-tRNA hydrolase